MRFFTSALIFAITITLSKGVASIPTENSSSVRDYSATVPHPSQESLYVLAYKGKRQSITEKEIVYRKNLPLRQDTNRSNATFLPRVVHKTHGLKSYTATITFAVTDRGTLYHNGKKLKTVKNPEKVHSIRQVVSDGDVISFLTVSLQSSGGLIADIRYGERHEVSSRSSSYRAQPAFPSANWKTPQYSDCYWPSPKKVERESLTYFAKNFPFGTGARYVWPESSPPAAAAYFRLVIGSSQCNAQRDSPEFPKYKQENAKVETKIGPKLKPTQPKSKKRETGLEPSYSNENRSANYENGNSRCNCREAKSGWSGICHEFLAKKDWKLNETGACKTRKCDSRFECVANDSAFTHRCIRKFAHQEVRPASAGPYSPPICILAGIVPPRPFLVPYD